MNIISQIDLKKHVLYSPLMEKVIKKHLEEKYHGDDIEKIMIHGHLIRKHTCANSDICDYWIVGDVSEAAKEHHKKIDDKGYWYND